VVEGLLIYLTAEEAIGLLATIGDLSLEGSRLACEQQDVDVGFRDGGDTRPRLARFTRMWKGGLGRYTPMWLAEHGGQVKLDDRDAVADGYGRPGPSPSAVGFITATRVMHADVAHARTKRE
jgi:O-methyltransferase involved in polyketide biosynthesis